RRCETANLELGGGLEVLVSAALGALDPGQELDVVSEARSAALELPAWARITGHEVVDERQERTSDGVRYVVRLRRGSIKRVLGESVSAGHTIPVLPGGGFPTDEARRRGPAGGSRSHRRPDPARGSSRAGIRPVRLAADATGRALVGQAREPYRPGGT